MFYITVEYDEQVKENLPLRALMLDFFPNRVIWCKQKVYFLPMTLFIYIIYHRYNTNMEDCKREGLGWGSKSSHPICISEFSATIKTIPDKILEGKSAMNASSPS